MCAAACPLMLASVFVCVCLWVRARVCEIVECVLLDVFLGAFALVCVCLCVFDVSQPSQANGMHGEAQGGQFESMSLLPEFQKKQGGDSSSSVARCFMPGSSVILHPYSTPRLAWDMWIVFLLVYTALVVPYSLAFQDAVRTHPAAKLLHSSSREWVALTASVLQVCGGESNRDIGAEVLQWLVDACFFSDIALNFITAIMDPNSDNLTSMQLVSDWKVIAVNYLKGWFALDIIGSFPVQVIETAMTTSGDGCSLTALKALRLNRLGRLARLLKLLRLVSFPLGHSQCA